MTTDEALGVYGAVDCGAYVANFLLAAEALGVATVPQASLAFYSDVIRRHFGLKGDRKIVCGISFGIANTEHPANGYILRRRVDFLVSAPAALADYAGGESR